MMQASGVSGDGWAELPPLRKAVAQFSYYLGLLVEVVAGVLLVCAAVLVVSQVAFRYILNSPLDWTEEAARYTAVWAGLLGAALGVRSSTHFSVLIITNRLSDHVRDAVQRVCYVIVTAMLLVVLWKSIQYVVDVGAVQLSPGMRISMAWLYSVIPVSSALMLVFMVCETVAGSVRTLWTEKNTSEAELIEKMVEEAERTGGLVVGASTTSGGGVK